MAVDLTDPTLLVKGLPHAQMAHLRHTAAVSWVDQVRGSVGFDDEGYWAVTRHRDVMAVSRDSETFSSSANTAIARFRADIPREHIDLQRAVMLNMDPPDHTKVRTIVSRGFTPRAINALRGALAERAARIVHAARTSGAGEFVLDIASELPLQAIAELLGVPQQDRSKIFEWTNRLVGYDDPERAGDNPYVAMMELFAYATAMAQERQEQPRDDIVTKLISAEIDGAHLTADEFGLFVMMLSVAGNETTRNAITHGMLAFLDHPEQWELFKAERPRTFADEVIRWATPVHVFQRTATRDVELGGAQIRRGDRVGLFYGSANYDEDVFTDPHTFDVLRTPNPHLGFGGSGAHYCLGANLARLEIELMFNEIADQMPDIRKVGEPERLHSGWVHGIIAMPVAYAKVPAKRRTAPKSESAVAPAQRKPRATRAAPAAKKATTAKKK